MKRVIAVLMMSLSMACSQPAIAQESVIGRPPVPAAVLKHRAFLPVVTR